MPIQPLDNRGQFISAEINHDFNKNRPYLNEYQHDTWKINTICTNDQINTGQRRKTDGDDDLVAQLFPGRTKNTLKDLANGVVTSIPARLCPTGLNLSSGAAGGIIPDAPPGAPPGDVPATATQAVNDNVNIVRFDWPKAGPESVREELYNIFQYPYENFLIIDAVPHFVTNRLKKIRFPPVPDFMTGEQEVGKYRDFAKFPATTQGAGSNYDPGPPLAPPCEGAPATVGDKMKFNPYMYSEYSIEQLNAAPEFQALTADDGSVYLPKAWPFRPKINIICTPHNIADPGKATNFPGALSYSIDNDLPPSVLCNNHVKIPGGISSVFNSVPLVFSWFYNQAEVSEGSCPIMMSRYTIKTQINGAPAAPGSQDKFVMKQNWTGGITEKNAPGGEIMLDASEKNEIRALKDVMTSKNMILSGSGQDKNIRDGFEGEASFLVQRKRGGDYLQIKSAYEFPANANQKGNSSIIYKLMQGPQRSLNNEAYLAGFGHLKNKWLGTPPTAWFRNRTYLVTGDWPAFCYCVFNRINCILLCVGGCKAGKPMDMIFRVYFPA